MLGNLRIILGRRDVLRESNGKVREETENERTEARDCGCSCDEISLEVHQTIIVLSIRFASGILRISTNTRATALGED